MWKRSGRIFALPLPQKKDRFRIPGFKAGHSTDQCTFLLKQTASYSVTHGSSVRAVFLDALKAFDQVLHMKLFEKLIQRKVPMCFVRLLKHWYKEQTMQIKWGKHFSESFHVSNGVRHGGVLSPYLFDVYLDDLSNGLNNINTLASGQKTGFSKKTT